MAILDQWGNPIRYGGRFLDATSNSGNHPAWPVLSESIRKSVSWWDLQTSTSISRRLFVNNGILKGAICQKAMYSVGQAFLPIFQGEDKAWGRKARRWLVDEWFPICDVRGGVFDFQTNLFLDSVSIDRDGDFGILLTETKDGYPQVQRIAQHRIRSNPGEKIVSDGPFKGLPIHMGVIYKDSRPVGYRVHEDPIHESDFAETRYKDIPARDFIHIYEPEWYDQGRGFPGMTHALNLFRSMAQSQEWEELSMLITSAIGLIEKNETGGLDPDDPQNLLNSGSGNAGSGLSMLTLEGGLIRYFKSNSGSGLEQFVNHKPGEEWDMFNDRLIRIAFVGFNWPVSVTWKPEGGGPDVRLDIAEARTSVRDRQSLLTPPARRQIGYAISKAIKLGILPFNSEWYKWGLSYPAQIGIDDGKERRERREDLKFGLTTMEKEIAAMGGDWLEVRAQIEAEVDDLIERAKRLSSKHSIPLDTAMALLQQQNANQQFTLTAADPSLQG